MPEIDVIKEIKELRQEVNKTNKFLYLILDELKKSNKTNDDGLLKEGKSNKTKEGK